MQDTISSWSKSITLLPWLSAVISVFTLWGYVLKVILTVENLGVKLTVAVIGVAATVIAALIAGAVALIGQWRQLKRDEKTIVSTLSEIKPKIDNIDHRTEKQSEKIDILVADVEYRKRLEASFPKGVSGKEMIRAGTTAMLEENENLLRQYRKLSLAYNVAQNQISELSTENTTLRNKIQELEIKLRCERSRGQPPEPCSSGWDLEPEI